LSRAKFDLNAFCLALVQVLETKGLPVSDPYGYGAHLYPRSILLEAANSTGRKYIPASIIQDANRKNTTYRGVFHLPEVAVALNGYPYAGSVTKPAVADAPAPVSSVVAARTAQAVAAVAGASTSDEELAMALSNGEAKSLVPGAMSGYVPYGYFDDVEAIIRSGMFYPVFITGLSGNGKTTMIDQVCAKLARELFRVNITVETDEDDLLGGFRLVDGSTVWQDGPVVAAMERGGILLLDEIDLASSKIMCLQPVLEGKGVFLKKVGRFVKPAAGFTVFATANTKGKGSDDGRFVGTNVMNEAFLDRFPICIEQDYPPAVMEKKILYKKMESLGIDKGYRPFADNLVKWASVIRKSFAESTVDEIITTRRLLNIIEGFAIFSKKRRAIELGLARFDQNTKTNFLQLYTKVDANIDDNTIPGSADKDFGKAVDAAASTF
jgi:MoxR-like ATPase